MVGFEQSRINKIKIFEEEYPAGFEDLREHIGTMKAGSKYSPKQYLFMFDTVVQYPNVKETMAVLKENGIKCATCTLSKVLMASSRYIDSYRKTRQKKELAASQEA